MSETRKGITFTDKKGIGQLQVKGTWYLNFYPLEQIKWVRLIRGADGYYVQFLLKRGKKRLKFCQRRVSRQKKGSSNRKKAINRLGRVHLKISRQGEEQAKRLARWVIQSNDLVAYENLRVKNLVKNCSLAKSIHDAGWYQFRKWLEYLGIKFG